MISMATDSPSEWMSQDLPRLVAKLAKPVFVGGRASLGYADAVAKAGATAIGPDISQGLRRIVSVLSGA